MRGMPYHIEVRATRRHARLFNLQADELQQRIVRPWQAGGPLLLADRRWEQRDSRLRILEGPELEGVDLAYGQGWNSAERTARDVTAEMLAGGAANAVAILAPDEETANAAAAVLGTIGLRAVEWTDVRRRILIWLAQPDTVPDLGVGAVLAICASDAPERWLFDAGLALGALGRRTVLVSAEGDLPAPLAGLAVLPLDWSAPDEHPSLAARLRQAGAAIPVR